MLAWSVRQASNQTAGSNPVEIVASLIFGAGYLSQRNWNKLNELACKLKKLMTAKNIHKELMRMAQKSAHHLMVAGFTLAGGFRLVGSLATGRRPATF